MIVMIGVSMENKTAKSRGDAILGLSLLTAVANIFTLREASTLQALLNGVPFAVALIARSNSTLIPYTNSMEGSSLLLGLLVASLVTGERKPFDYDPIQNAIEAL